MYHVTENKEKHTWECSVLLKGEEMQEHWKMALNLTGKKEFIMIGFNGGTGMKVGLPELKI